MTAWKESRAPAVLQGPKEPPAASLRDRHASMARSATTVAAYVMVSRITGFGRIAVTAAVFGPTYFGNLFQFANLLPFMVFGLLSGSLIPAIVVPRLVQRIDRQDREGAARLANGFLGLLLVILAGVAAIGILATPLLLQVMLPAAGRAAAGSGQLQLCWLLTGLMFPQLLFYGISAVATAAQQAHGRFALAAGATAIDNLGNSAVVLASAVLFGRGTELGDVSLPQALLLGLGATATAATSAVMQWWGASRAGLRLVPSLGWKDGDVRSMFRSCTSSIGYTCLSIPAFFGMLSMASRVPGGVAAFQIAHSFIHLPVALAASSVATVQLPELARSFHEQQSQAFAATYRCALRLVLFVMIPGSLLLVTIGPALAQASAFGEMATPFGVSLIGACIVGRGLGALGEAILVVGTSASYARQDTASPIRAMMILLAVSATGMVLGSMTSNAQHLMLTLAISTTAASSLAAFYLHRQQPRGVTPAAGRYLRDGAADLAASLVAMLPAWLIVNHAASQAPGPWQGIQVAAAAAILATLTYLTIQFARGSDEMMLLLPLPARLKRQLEQRCKARADAMAHAPGST